MIINIIKNLFYFFQKYRIRLYFHSRFITASIVSELILHMPKRKSKRKLTSKIIQPDEETQTTPRTAKIVLFVFGVGPLILMGLFLSSNGFFNSP